MNTPPSTYLDRPLRSINDAIQDRLSRAARHAPVLAEGPLVGAAEQAGAVAKAVATALSFWQARHP